MSPWFSPAASLGWTVFTLALLQGSEPDSSSRIELPSPRVHATWTVADGSLDVAWTSPSDGRLRVWTRARSADFDPRLGVRDATDAGVTIVEDDDTAGDSEAFVQMDVVAGQTLRFVVAPEAGSQPGTCELRCVLARETPESTAVSARILALLAPYADGDFSAAPPDVVDSVTEALREATDCPGAFESSAVESAVWKLGIASVDLARPELAIHAMLWVEAWRARFFPEHHVELQKPRVNLGFLYQQTEELIAARNVLERAVDALGKSPEYDGTSGRDARTNLGAVLYRIGDFERARRVQQEVLELSTRLLPEGHSDLRDARKNLAATLGYLGEHALGLELELLVLEDLERDPSRDARTLAQMREKVAGTHEALNDYASSLPIRQRLVESLSAVSEPTARELIEARLLLARALRYSGSMEDSRDLQAELLELAGSALAPDDDLVTRLRIDLGVTLQLLGDLDPARDLLVAAHEVLVRSRADDDPLLQTARLSLAELFEYRGDYAAALELYEKAYAVARVIAREEDPSQQSAMAGVARCSRPLGDLVRARELGERLLAVMERRLPDDHLRVQLVRLELGSALFEEGDLDTARVLQEKALAVLSRRSDPDDGNLQAARSGLSHTLSRLGRHDEALDLAESAREVLERTLPRTSPERLAAVMGVASVLAMQGENARALALMESVEEDFALAYGEGAVGRNSLRFNLAYARMALGRHDEAGPEFASIARSWNESLPADHPDHAWIRRHILLDRIGARDEVGVERAARDLAEVLPRIVSSPEKRTSRENEERAYSLRHSVAALAVCVLPSARGIRVKDLENTLFEAIETLRAPALVQARIVSSARGPVFDRIRFEEREAARVLAARIRGAADMDAVQNARARLESIRRERRTELARHPEAALADVRPTRDAVAASLAPDEVLIGTWRHASADDLFAFGNGSASPRFLAHVTRRDAPTTFVDLGPAEEIETRVEAWRESLGVGGPTRGLAASSSSSDDANGAGEALRRAIFDPLISAIGDARTLVLLPDDVLLLVAYDALPASDGGVLGDRFVIRMRLSVREELWDAHPPSTVSSVLAIGGIDYSPAARNEEADAPSVDLSILRGGPFQNGFTDLPGSRVEIRRLAALRGDDVVLLEGRDATVERIERQVSTARWIHVATHGWFAPESVRVAGASRPIDAHIGAAVDASSDDDVRAMNPMVLCGLALAGANAPTDGRGSNPGLITAEELSTWDLRECELAVLSACETNVGLVRAGQGVASLQKALHTAGARSVLTSLWKVPDGATADLMAEFYRLVWQEKRGKGAALREAKALLRGRRDAEGRPLHGERDWAAWVLTGDTD